MTTAYLRVILSMEILISYAPYRHQRYSSTNSLKRTAVCMVKERVCFPYEFTLLSNNEVDCFCLEQFVSPTNLHCSQTTFLPRFISAWFVSPTNLHCSQTEQMTVSHNNLFVSPTNLHCSQTVCLCVNQSISLFPLRIYTALKPVWNIGWQQWRLFPLRIYTALKLKSSKNNILQNTRVPS